MLVFSWYVSEIAVGHFKRIRCLYNEGMFRIREMCLCSPRCSIFHAIIRILFTFYPHARLWSAFDFINSQVFTADVAHMMVCGEQEICCRFFFCYRAFHVAAEPSSVIQEAQAASSPEHHSLCKNPRDNCLRLIVVILCCTLPEAKIGVTFLNTAYVIIVTSHKT
jgi:hypothetical protein